MDTERPDRESATESKGAGWKWIPDQGVWLWWDGQRYTRRADWDGTEWQSRPLAGGVQRSRMKPITKALVYGLRGLAIAVVLDFLIFIMVANTPTDEQTMTEETAIGVLAVMPLVGFLLGAAVGWFYRNDG